LITPQVTRAGLDGPSRTIILDPIETPQPQPQPQREPEPQRQPEPAEAPEREPEKVPA